MEHRGWNCVNYFGLGYLSCQTDKIGDWSWNILPPQNKMNCSIISDPLIKLINHSCCPRQKCFTSEEQNRKHRQAYFFPEYHGCSLAFSFCFPGLAWFQLCRLTWKRLNSLAGLRSSCLLRLEPHSWDSSVLRVSGWNDEKPDRIASPRWGPGPLFICEIIINVRLLLSNETRKLLLSVLPARGL